MQQIYTYLGEFQKNNETYTLFALVSLSIAGITAKLVYDLFKEKKENKEKKNLRSKLEKKLFWGGGLN